MIGWSRTLLILSIMCLLGCAPKAINTIYSSTYDQEIDKTVYSVLPYGQASLPGKWVKGNYVDVSRQQFFVNKDSLWVSIAFGPIAKCEFYKQGLKDYAFAKAYYEWESKYQTENLRLAVEPIVSDSIDKYIIWKMVGVNTHMCQLIGTKDCNCKEAVFEGLTIRSNHMTDDEMVAYLKAIYFQQRVNTQN